MFYRTSIKTKLLGYLGDFLAWLADAAYVLLQKANSAEDSASAAEHAAMWADFERAIDKAAAWEARLNVAIDQLEADRAETWADLDWLQQALRTHRAKEAA